MAGAFAATDFLAKSPNIETIAIEQESEDNKSGRDLALTRFKNRLRFASEGFLIGGGFSLMGKPLAVGLKYGLFKPCLLYTSPSPRDRTRSRMPSSA